MIDEGYWGYGEPQYEEEHFNVLTKEEIKKGNKALFITILVLSFIFLLTFMIF